MSDTQAPPLDAVKIALKPCPFCGSANVDPEGWFGNDGSKGPACDDCRASAESAEHWNRRAALDAVAGAVAVKPLVWRHYTNGNAWAAPPIGIPYYVTPTAWAYRNGSPNPVEGGIAAAKAAAQADYESRILSALVAAPPAAREDSNHFPEVGKMASNTDHIVDANKMVAPSAPPAEAGRVERLRAGFHIDMAINGRKATQADADMKYAADAIEALTATLAARDAEVARLREALITARESILDCVNSRWSEYEGTDADHVGFIDAALTPVTRDAGGGDV